MVREYPRSGVGTFVRLSSAGREQDVHVLFAVADEGVADDSGDAFAALAGDGVHVGPQLVVDADGALRCLSDVGHAVTVVGCAVPSQARCPSHTISVTYD